MGAVKKWLMEQEEREYNEKLLEANERDNPDKFEQECEDRWIEEQIERWIARSDLNLSDGICSLAELHVTDTHHSQFGPLGRSFARVRGGLECGDG